MTSTSPLRPAPGRIDVSRDRPSRPWFCRPVTVGACGLWLVAACQTLPEDETGTVAPPDAGGVVDENGDPGLRSAAAPLVPVASARTDGLDADADPLPETDSPATLDGVNLEELLSMSFGEASLMSPASTRVGADYKVAAEEIDVLQRDPGGQPTHVIARGRVFVEMRMDEVVVALADSAEIGPGELILRGRPVVGRGFSVLAGTEDDTVFVLAGDALRVSGGHQAMRRSAVPVRRDQLIAGVSGGRGSAGGSGGEPARSYRIDSDFELPPLPDVTEDPDPVLLEPPPELPEIP